MIELTDVSKRYGARAALAHVSATLRPGEVTLLLGPNGAGKSTLLRCVLGLTSFDGQIRVDGLDPLVDGRAVRARIGYMPQTGGLHTDLTVEQTMWFYADIRRAPRDRCARLLAEAGLAGETATRVGDLSGGMRQRLGFAIALLTDPSILVLDEPSASLDRASREWLVGRLREVAREGRTVLVSTHGDELFAASDRRITLESGAIVHGPGGVDPHEPSRPEAAAPGGIRTDALRAVDRGAALLPIVRKEWRDAIRNRWLIGYAVLLATLGVAATATGLDSTAGLNLQAFGRTTATLMNLCLLLAPLVAVLMGAGLIAGEQERGTLEHLLAQPLSRTQLLLGKHAGLLLALGAATLAGFLPAGLLIAASLGPAALGHYLLFPAIAVLAAAAMAGLGAFISVSSRSAVQAQGAAVFTWFAFVLLYDLLVIGALAVSGLRAEALVATLLANPIDAARVLGVLALEPDLYLLGPAGAFLSARLSPAGTAGLLATTLILWALAPLGLATVRFSLPLRRTHSHETNRIHVARDLNRTRRGDRVHVGRGVARL